MSLIAVAASLIVGHAQIDPRVVTWRTYKAGDYSDAQDLRIVEMNNSAEYQRYVNMYHPKGAGDAHDVDWNREELVAIHIGARRTGGYSVEVNSITKAKPTEAVVAWSELTPVQGLAKSQAQTSPWTIVRLNRPGVKLVYSGDRREGRLPGGIQIFNFPGYDWGCTCCFSCVRQHQSRLPWRTYAKGDNAGTLLASTISVNSADEFASFVRNYKLRGLGDGSDVDWSRERLFAMFLGSKITTGSQILVDHVEIADASRVDVSFYEINPVSPQFAIGGSAPYLVIRIPRYGGLVTGSKHFARDCDRIDLDECGCGCQSCRYCHARAR